MNKIFVFLLILSVSLNFIFCQETLEISKVKVASLYERVIDGIGIFIGRSIDDVVNLLNETKTDFIFRGWWRWSPCPESCFELPPQYIPICERNGYSYQNLQNAIKKIKDEIPGIIFCGAIPAQIIQRESVWNPLTHEIIRYPETWEMALDPEKWGIDVSKKEFQCWFGKTHFWVDPDLNCQDYDPEKAAAYFPDITNKRFQKLLLSWAKKQIDCGADAIWIDMLFKQARMLAAITGDQEHSAVKDSFEAALKIVNEIHSYGMLKGKHIYVGSWPSSVDFSYAQPSLDFVTLSPSSKEVLNMKFDELKWDEKISKIREKMGDIPIFAFIDWASTTKTPLGVFSQNLTSEQQKEFLKIADQFFLDKGVIFIYPVHGGWMGRDAEILSFGVSKVYDSLAPEFQTYETIKELAQKKKSKKIIGRR